MYDNWILYELVKTIELVNRHLSSLNFSSAAKELIDFFWHKLCDTYFEISKISSSLTDINSVVKCDLQLTLSFIGKSHHDCSYFLLFGNYFEAFSSISTIPYRRTMADIVFQDLLINSFSLYNDISLSRLKPSSKMGKPYFNLI